MTRYLGRGSLFAIVLATLPALLSPAPASAFTMLTAQQRGQILRSADMVGPDGKRITDPACIGGRLSTVDPRHEAGAGVLRDLGCAFFDHRPQRVRHCSNAGAPPDFFLANITTRHVSCRTAMRFIISLHGSRPFFKTEVTHLHAYTCTPSSEGVAATWVRCVGGRRLIRWLNGT